MTKTTKTTTTTSNGSTYEILIHHNWLNGTVTCMDDGRSYAFAADDAETIDEAIAEAADWCEWHSVHGNEHILHEVAPEPECEMTKYMLTGKTINGNFQDKPFTSCSKHDLPTCERITITIDGIEYERTIFERIKYRTQGEHTHIAFFVIVNGTQYEIGEASDLLAHAIEPAFELADFEVVTKEDILNMDCNYNIGGEDAYRLLRGTDSCIISFAQGEWCAEYIHWYYDANGEMVEDYLEDFFGDAPYKVCDKASAYAVKVAELIKAEGRD